MSRVRWSISLFSLIILSLIAGCGYTFGNLLLDGEKSLVLKELVNDSIYSCDFLAETELQSAFSRRGIRLFTSEKVELSHLHITIKEGVKAPSIYDDDNKPLQYKMTLKVSYKLLKGEKVLKEGNVSDTGFYYPERAEDNTEEDALSEALQKISDKVVENLLDRW